MREEGKTKRKSDYTFIKVRLPDGVTIQATFGTGEKLADLRAFLDEKIQFAQKFFFVLLPSKNFEESEEEKTFLELDLFPSVTLMLKWCPDEGPDHSNLPLNQDN
nr:uncharacterized protein LOC106689861 [Halyomorpha halys]